MPTRVDRKTEPHRARAGRACIIAALLLVVAGCQTASDEMPELSVTPAIAPAAPGTLDLVQRALDEDRYGDARKLLDRVLIAEPENPLGRLLAAELQLAVGSHQTAAEAFGKLVELPEVHARALQGRGIALMLMGERTTAFDGLTGAVEEDPALWRAWNAIGYYHDYNAEWDQAVQAYDKALESNPESALIYNNRGFSMLMQGRLEEATADLNRSLRLDPGFDVARQNLRLVFAWEGKYVHALAGVEDRDMARALNNIGFIALLRGDYTNAEAYLLRAMELDPSYNEVASRNLVYLRHVRELQKAESLGTPEAPAD
jgi:Flp pilus assembly protein TadD